MKTGVFLGLLALSAVVAANAQEESHFAFQVGAGFTQGVGRTGMYTDTGWNTSAGFGYNFNPYVGALVDLGVTSLGINSATLSSIGGQSGYVNVFSATLDPVVHLNPYGRMDVYLTGGGGEFRRSQVFGFQINPSTFNPNPFLFTNASNSSVFGYSVNKPGIDAGVGIAFGTRGHGKIFAEAKYDRIFMNGYRHTDFIPVTFGYRW